jgi:hypothetical protein
MGMAARYHLALWFIQQSVSSHWILNAWTNIVQLGSIPANVPGGRQILVWGMIGGGGVAPNFWASKQNVGNGAPSPWGLSARLSGQAAAPAPNQMGFHNLTVQQMLGAQEQMFRDMMNQFQQQVHQSLQQYQVVQPVQGQGGGGLPSRPSYFQTSSV